MSEEYFDRDCLPISFKRWTDLFQDNCYQQLIKTELDNGITISTVWLGLVHGYGPQGPEIFETIVFLPDDNEQELYRYATEEEARNHHEHLAQTYYDEHNPPSRWAQVIREIEKE